MAFLTDLTLAPAINGLSLIHIVNPSDTSQNPAGSSYKTSLQTIFNFINPAGITGGTYNPNTGVITFYNSSGGSFDISGFTTGYTDIQVTGFTYDNNNTFTISETDGTTHSATINQMSGLTVNGNLTVTGNTSLNSTTASTLTISSTPSNDTSTNTQYLTRDSSTGEVKIKTSAGLSVYGLFAMTANSSTVSGTTSETTIIGNGVGGLTVPANGFNAGDSFSLKMFGDIGSSNTSTLRIQVKSGSVVLGDTGLISMPNITSSHFMLDIGFTIRATGTTGNAVIATSGFFAFLQNASNNYDAKGFSTINNTTFNTTISNTLNITAQFSSTNAANFIYSEYFVLNKVY